MRRLWSADELGEFWTLLPEDLALLAGLPAPASLAWRPSLHSGASSAVFPTMRPIWRRGGRAPGQPRSEFGGYS